MRTTILIVAVTLTVWLKPASALAQGFVAPSLGVTFNNPSSEGRANFVADLGWLPRREPIGVELDVMYAPSFFGNQGPYGQNSVTTVMGNVIVAGGGESRGRHGSSVRPYVSGGVGVMNELLTTGTAHRMSNNDLAVNAGIGVMAFSRRSVGVRADLRYLRDLKDNQAGNSTSIDFGSFHFWRAGLGVVVAF